MHQAGVILFPLVFSGCAGVAVPFTVRMDFEVSGVGDTEGAVSEDDLQAISAVWATEVQDLDDARDDLPKQAEFESVDLQTLTIGSPDIGPLGQWVARFALYASKDDRLQDEDILIGDFEYLDEDKEEVTTSLPDEANGMFLGHQLALVIDATLRELPEEELSVPVEIEAVGYVAPL